MKIERKSKDITEYKHAILHEDLYGWRVNSFRGFLDGLLVLIERKVIDTGGAEIPDLFLKDVKEIIERIRED